MVSTLARKKNLSDSIIKKQVAGRTSLVILSRKHFKEHCVQNMFKCIVCNYPVHVQMALCILCTFCIILLKTYHQSSVERELTFEIWHWSWCPVYCMDCQTDERNMDQVLQDGYEQSQQALCVASGYYPQKSWP